MTSEVFPPGAKPRTVDKAHLLSLLDQLRKLVENDDSMEGALMYAWSDEPSRYDVGGFIRTGNLLGQGGALVLWDDAS